MVDDLSLDGGLIRAEVGVHQIPKLVSTLLGLIIFAIELRSVKLGTALVLGLEVELGSGSLALTQWFVLLWHILLVLIKISLEARWLLDSMRSSTWSWLLDD